MSQKKIGLIPWSSDAPLHEITAMAYISSSKTLVTGAQNGHICFWSFEHDTITPKHLLIGHATSVVAVVEAMVAGTRVVVTVSKDGMMRKWSLLGESIASNIILPGPATSVQVFLNGTHLLCCGDFPDIIIVSVSKLKVIERLQGNYLPEWHSTATIMHFRDEKGAEYEGVVAVTPAGLLKIFALRRYPDRSMSSSSIVDASMLAVRTVLMIQIRSLRPLMLTVNQFTRAVALIISANEWDLYAYPEFRHILRIKSKRSTPFSGGIFLTERTVLLWYQDGTSEIQSLPDALHVLIVEAAPLPVLPIPEGDVKVELDASASNSASSALPVSLMHAFCTTEQKTGDVGGPLLRGAFPVVLPINTDDGAHTYLLQGNNQGCIHVWNLDAYMHEVPPSPSLSVESSLDDTTSHRSLLAGMHDDTFKYDNSRAVVVLPTSTSTFRHAWALMNITLTSFFGNHVSSGMTVCILVDQEYLIHGYTDGSILASSIFTLCHEHLGKDVRPCEMFLPRVETEVYNPPQHVIFKGHTGRVTCLLQPKFQLSANKEWIVSGSSDFTVRLWLKSTGKLVHTFSPQSGEIVSLHHLPSDTSIRMKNSIGSVSRDHSVAILSLDPPACCHLIAGHPFPVTSVRWRALDDFLMVGCTDGSVYVWHLGSLHLDSHASGQAAVDILLNCDPVMAETVPFESSSDIVAVNALNMSGADTQVLSLQVDVTRIIGVIETFDATKSYAKDVAALALSCNNNVKLVYFIISMLWPWGRDDKADGIARELGFLPATTAVSICVTDKNTWSIPMPNTKGVPSNSIYSTVMLGALLYLLSKADETDERWLELRDRCCAAKISGLSVTLLADLTSFWMHECAHVMNAGRQLLLSQLYHLTLDEQQRFVDYCVQKAPQLARHYFDDARVKNLLLLGIMCTKLPAVAEPHSAFVTKSLLALLREERADVNFRGSAALILSSVLTGRTTDDVVLVLRVMLGNSENQSDYRLSRMTTEALVNIAEMDMISFIVASCAELDEPQHQSQFKILQTISQILKNRPDAFRYHISKLVEMLMRCQDPATSRDEKCHWLAIDILHNLAQETSQISYLPMAFRVGVGNEDGSVHLYDVKTSARVLTLQGSGRAVTAVCFSPDGKAIASYSRDNRLRLWQLQSAPSFLGGILGNTASSAKCYREFPTPDLDDGPLRIVWTTKRDLILITSTKKEIKFTA